MNTILSKDERIQKLKKQLKEKEAEIQQLKKENKNLQDVAEKLTRLLNIFCNPHTPPSKQMLKQKRNKKKICKKLGAPQGHRGATRMTPKPTGTKLHALETCPHCSGKILKLSEVLRRIIEEIPEPQPAEVTEHFMQTGICVRCGCVVAESDLPDEGDFGKNVLSHVTLLRFEDRLPIRKVVGSLKRQHNIKVTHTTVLDITRRVSNKLRVKYEQITYEIRRAPFVHIDQTDIKVGGVTYQLWVFVTQSCTLFIIRKAGYADVMQTVLGKRYKGIIIGDGLETYRQYTDLIQRCWAHLLRDSADLAEKHDSAKILHKGLKKLFENVNNVTYEDPPDERQRLYDKCVAEMRQWIEYVNIHKELRKFAVTLSNGLKHWFTRILHPFIEATNNRAERALREFVVIRKIIGTLRNKKGTEIVETIMTMIATWKQRGLDTFSMMRTSI
jgi:transposase